ncbi:MAG: hypothetical protein KBF82_01325 [Chitinophagaceae bacterium]|nr:hypothetical protein [Chitinophagaceae bacterium]
MRLLTLFILCLTVFILPSNAQETATAPASHFSTSGGKKFWMGANYRTEWNTPVTVPVLSLKGLTPIKKGGGKQTKSLRMEDASGRQFIIRSIQKFITDKTLPGDLQSEAAADLVSDGVSASYPYASLSMQPLADAVGVPYGKVKLVYVPDDAALGEFQKDFGGMLATFEERLPENVTKGYDTEEVAEKLEKDNDNQADQKALLTARILDMFVMDLDRHEGQWNWGAVDNANGGKTYFPIPKDRDQAFYINQGLIPGIARRKTFVPQLEGFKAKAHDIKRFNFAARNLDRFFLNALTAADWQKAVDDFLPKMTDQVIENALAMQPAEIRALPHNQSIVATLKERRQYLAEEVMKYYRFLAETVTVTASDKHDLFDITRNDDGSMLVQVYKLKDGQKADKKYERLFIGGETKEVRLFGFDGDDKFVIHGNNDKVKIRMIGGGGADVFEKTSSGRGSSFVYDKNNGENKLIGKFKNHMSNDSDVNKFERISYNYDKRAPGLAIGYNPDDGVFLGLTYKIINQGFRKDPYKASHTFYVSHALSTNAWNFRYANEFIGVVGKNADITTDIDIKAPNNTTNFFGYGVNSVYDKSQPGKFKYYRARYNRADATVMIRERFSPKFSISFGPTFQRFELDATDKFNSVRFITQTGMLPGQNGLDATTLYKTQYYFGGQVAIELDTRDNKVNPNKGVTWITTARHLSGISNTPYSVTQLNSDLGFYFNVINNRLVFANRVGGGINLGNKGYEFYQAQYLGNEENLRGYRRYRFAGKSKLYNQAELRLKIADFRTYLFPGSIGIYGFYDIGRVWVANDTQKKTLSGYGGGLWISPLRRIMLNVGYGVSKEDGLLTIGLGWKF